MLWTKDLLHVWHDIDRTITDNATDEWRPRACVRAKGGHFQQILWQYSAIWQETFQFLSKMTRFLDFFFRNYHKFELLSFARQYGDILKVWYYMGCVANLLLFPAVKEFWKSVKNWQSYRPEFVVLLFGTQCSIWLLNTTLF